MSSGREYARKLDQATAQLGRDHDAKSAELDALNRDIAATQRAVSKAYLAIAKDHVAALDAEELQAYDQVTEEAVLHIRNRLTQVRELRGSVERRMAEEEQALKHQLVAVEARDRDAAKVRALEHSVDQGLADQVEYGELQAAEKTAVAIATRAAEKARLAAEEGAKKLSAYEGDTIFMYLHGRGYGSAEYRRKTPHLVRVVDGWVARLCGYAAARKDYQTLTTMPTYLQRHAERMEQNAAANRQRGEQYRQDKLRKAGIEPLLESFRRSDATLADRDASLATAREKLDAARQSLHLVEEWRDPPSATLLGRMAKTFSQEGFEKLRGRVRSTSTAEDDANLSRIEKWLDDVKTKIAQGDEIRTYIQAIDDRRGELVSLRRQFRQKGYDSSDYKISGRRVDDLLTGYILGTVVRGDLWSGISSSVRYDPPRRPSSSSSSGGFGSGGGFRTGGGFSGGGGFRTGGGF